MQALSLTQGGLYVRFITPSIKRLLYPLIPIICQEETTMRRISFRLFTAASVLVLFALTSHAAFAWLIIEGYAGPYPSQYTVENGTLYGDYDPNNPPGGGSYGGNSSFHWSSAGSTWIGQNINQFGFSHNKAAIVWHAVDKPDVAHCANLDALNWAATNFPNPRIQPRSHCSGYNEEIRVLYDSLTAPTVNMNYTAQIQYNVRSGVTGGQFNISTYWLDYADNPISNVPGQGRGYMNKICFNHPGQYYFPSNGNC